MEFLIAQAEAAGKQFFIDEHNGYTSLEPSLILDLESAPYKDDKLNAVWLYAYLLQAAKRDAII